MNGIIHKLLTYADLRLVSSCIEFKYLLLFRHTIKHSHKTSMAQAITTSSGQLHQLTEAINAFEQEVATRQDNVNAPAFLATSNPRWEEVKEASKSDLDSVLEENIIATLQGHFNRFRRNNYRKSLNHLSSMVRLFKTTLGYKVNGTLLEKLKWFIMESVNNITNGWTALRARLNIEASRFLELSGTCWSYVTPYTVFFENMTYEEFKEVFDVVFQRTWEQRFEPQIERYIAAMNPVKDALVNLLQYSTSLQFVELNPEEMTKQLQQAKECLRLLDASVVPYLPPVADAPLPIINN